MDAVNVLITGTGALASLFAAHLSEAGVGVSMLGHWPEGLDALRANGVRLRHADGSEKAYPVRVLDDPAHCDRYSLALVLVKSWQTARTAGQLKKCLHEDGIALTLQNGFGNLEQLAAALGADRVTLGVTTVGATLLAPGLVRVGGSGYLRVGSHPRAGQWIELLQRTGFDAEETNDTDSLVWSKLVINAAINPLTAILGVPNGVLLESDETRSRMAQLALEAAAVAGARGTSLSFSDPVAAAEDVAMRTAQNLSSMLQDIQRGAPTEIDAICGAIVREGRRLGVPTPANEAAWRLVREAVRAPNNAEEYRVH